MRQQIDANLGSTIVVALNARLYVLRHTKTALNIANVDTMIRASKPTLATPKSARMVKKDRLALPESVDLADRMV